MVGGVNTQIGRNVLQVVAVEQEKELEPVRTQLLQTEAKIVREKVKKLKPATKTRVVRKTVL